MPSNFDSYSGEKFTVDPAGRPARQRQVRQEHAEACQRRRHRLQLSLHQAGADWKIVDVYLAGNISQLAQKRSDFAATLASGGPQGLAKKINALADQMLDG